MAIHRRAHYIDLLKRIVPHAHEAALSFYELVLHFPAPERKKVFVHFWQRQARCLAELENKIREEGGDWGDLSSIAQHPDVIPRGAPAEPYTQDKIILLRCLNQQFHLLHLYTEARKNVLPFDLSMLLHRHQVETEEMLNHLRPLYLQDSAAALETSAA